MADEILIKVRADVDGLQADVQNAKKTLEQLELLDKEYKPKINFSNLQELQKSIIKISSSTGDIWDAAAFKKKISESVNDSKALNEIRNQFVQMANSADKTDASFDELIATVKGLDKQIEFLNNNPVEIIVDEKPMVSLRSQMRKAQQEVAELSLKFGATSKEATEAAKRAAELKDAIGDAKDLTDAFSPDAKFNALTGSIQGVVGGFTALQGAIGAFGVENEEVEKALLKVNSAMALSQGLQSVGQSVDSFKNLGAVIKNTAAFQALYNNATKIATAVQTAFGVATNVTTTGFKLLRGAIISTGIGALVVGLGMVIANFDAISAWIKSSPLGEFANQVGNIVQKFTDFIGITSESERSLDRLTKANARANESLNARIKILKAQGGSEQEVYKLSKQVIENNLNDVRNAAKAKGVLSTEEAKKIRELKVEELVLTAEYNKKIADDNEKANEKTRAANEKAAEEERKDREKSNEMLRNLRNNNTLDAIKDSEQRALKQLEIEDKRQRDEIALLKISNEQKAALYKELDVKLEKGRADIAIKEREKTYEAELKAVQENFDKQEVILKEQLANKIIDENTYNKKIQELQISELEAKVLTANKFSATVKKAAEDATTFEKEVNDKRLDIAIETNKKIKINIESVGTSIGDAYKRGYQTAKDSQDELLEKQKQALLEIYDLAKNGILLQLGINPQDADRLTKSLTDIYQKIKEGKPIDAGEIADTAGSAYFAVSNAIAASDAQRRQEELAALQAQQEEELRLAGDNEQKKDLIKQKYALKEKEIKRKQAEADKRKAIIDATVNTAVAIVKTFATMGFLAGLVPAALMAALGAAQVAFIAAQPLPKFEKGGAVPSSDINGMISGKPHSAGGVLIEAEGNEFITRRSQAMKGDNLGLLEAINMSDNERDAYINRHYVMPALQAKESQAAKNYRSSIIEAENNLIARVSSSTLKSIDRRLVETNQSIKGLAKKDYTW